ncbi:hypothetical protein K7T73_01980 [Bacillus badius]|uniref:hypothetical protein n=1 Tax=Bacillus badius TaxID=1455 RepID=UPI001CBE0050|nr:hypothetical protein [Bacillus badius]UAT31062.1 hypothetical protein K7T73_01980 [Bacillus badius]
MKLLKTILQKNNKENGVENFKQKGITTIAKSNIEPTNHNNEISTDKCTAGMENIRDGSGEYEEKYGDKAMEYLRLDSVIRELARAVKAEESIVEYKQKLQREKEAERRKWDKLFEGGRPVERRQTINNLLEVFQRIRNGGKMKRRTHN